MGGSDRSVAVLGTGLMGTAMAHRMLDQGLAVVVWDRAIDHARPLAGRGAEVVATAAEAVRGARAVITMLPLVASGH
ncbi:MAG TPA: NAD(P)-binding domain-containing protein [Baekduia sp.]|uniref:NAD(P)-binding domain-containing protein n=1 Tax=Baekduia sp. TaxID=2600305 RepID=UPI002D76547C|nr:NAD(P)-binding domain-containing protein [Baekduia sp.]HET6506970.1 NAD(P)-binding domain-containing protein [Baekduia sp.]